VPDTTLRVVVVHERAWTAGIRVFLLFCCFYIRAAAVVGAVMSWALLLVINKVC